MVLPVDVDDDRTERKGRRVCCILAPDGARVPASRRGIPGEVDVDDVDEQPGDEGQDLEGHDGLRAVLIPLGEGVVCPGCKLHIPKPRKRCSPHSH